MIGFSIGAILRRILQQMIYGSAGFVVNTFGVSPGGYFAKFWVLYFTYAYYFLIAYCIFRIVLRLLAYIGIEPTWKVGKKDKKIKEIMGWKWYFKYGLFAILLPITLLWSKTIGARIKEAKEQKEYNDKVAKAKRRKEKNKAKTGEDPPSKKDMKLIEDKDEDDEDEDKDEDLDLDDDEEEEKPAKKPTKAKPARAAPAAAASAPALRSAPRPLTREQQRWSAQAKRERKRLQRQANRRRGRP